MNAVTPSPAMLASVTQAKLARAAMAEFKRKEAERTARVSPVVCLALSVNSK